MYKRQGFYYGGTFISSLTTAMILDFLGGSACIIYLVILCVAACIFTTLATVMSPLVKQRKALEKAAAEQEPSPELSSVSYTHLDVYKRQERRDGDRVPRVRA